MRLLSAPDSHAETLSTHTSAGGRHPGRRRLAGKAEEDVAGGAHEAGQQHQAAGRLVAAAPQLRAGHALNMVCMHQHTDSTLQFLLVQDSVVLSTTCNLDAEGSPSEAAWVTEECGAHPASGPGRSGRRQRAAPRADAAWPGCEAGWHVRRTRPLAGLAAGWLPAPAQSPRIADAEPSRPAVAIVPGINAAKIYLLLHRSQEMGHDAHLDNCADVLAPERRLNDGIHRLCNVLHARSLRSGVC